MDAKQIQEEGRRWNCLCGGDPSPFGEVELVGGLPAGTAPQILIKRRANKLLQPPSLLLLRTIEHKRKNLRFSRSLGGKKAVSLSFCVCVWSRGMMGVITVVPPSSSVADRRSEIITRPFNDAGD